MNTLISCRIKNSQIEKNNRKIKENSRSVFGAYEWAKLSANFIDGCKNDCKYCYSKEMAIRFNRKTARNWKKEEIRKHSLSKKFKKIKGTVMFPSSHDIHPEHLKESIIFLDNILSAGNKVLIVSKPSLKCIREICKNFNKFKGNILFRFTIGSSNSNILRFWEPYAPDFKERLASLKWAHKKGFHTSVSCEPMLDNQVDDVIEKVIPYVTDAIWIGKANFLLKRLRLNHADDKKTMRKAHELIEWQSDENIMELYFKLNDNPKIKWKESIKRIVGLKIPTQKGLDI